MNIVKVIWPIAAWLGQEMKDVFYTNSDDEYHYFLATYNGDRVFVRVDRDGYAEIEHNDNKTWIALGMM